MRFANPEAFALLLTLPLALGWTLRRRRGAARFSNLELAGQTPSAWATWGPALLVLLRVSALTLLVVTLARPQTAQATGRSHTEGIAIELVLDNSHSMKTRDYDLDHQSLSRLEAVKHAMKAFLKGGEFGLEGRPNDKIGLITFARDPEVVCPLTLDHAAVAETLERVPLAPPVGTNIGDALVWALDRLRTDPTREKVIILLSDGAHNVRSALPPLEAAELAAQLKIRVYTIGAVGNRQREAGAARSNNAEDFVDELMMRQIAERTGGAYFRATDTDGLVQIYRAIDRLETTRIERAVRLSHSEWFLAPLLPAVGLLLLEQLLAATRLLRIP